MSKAYREVRAIMVDSETGEVLEGMALFDSKPGKHYWGDYFLTIFQEALKRIAQSKMGGESLRVLVYLMGTIGTENRWMVFNQREIAATLEIHESQVSRALKDLASKQIITKGTRIGKGHIYMLNPNLGWKGNFKLHAPAKQKAPEMALV